MSANRTAPSRRTLSVSKFIVMASLPSVLGTHVVPILGPRMAREPACRVTALRRCSGRGAGRERIGSGVVVEYGVAPSSAVGEPPAVFHHEATIHTVANPIVKTLLRFITHLRTVVIDFFGHGVVPQHRRMTPHKRGRFHQTKVSSTPSYGTAGHETVV